MKQEYTIRDFRSFGLVFAVALSIFGLWGFWRDAFVISEVQKGLLGAAGCFLVLGLVIPRSLAVPHKLWMAFGEKLGVVVTTVLLTTFFYTVITFTGLIRRAIGADSLGLKRLPEGESYWRPKEVEERGLERYEHPF